jgi:hypothetical protein
MIELYQQVEFLEELLREADEQTRMRMIREKRKALLHEAEVLEQDMERDLFVG